MSSLPLSVVCSTIPDGANTIDGSPSTFSLSTGHFPHEIVYSFPSNVMISQVKMKSKFVRRVVIFRCEKNPPVVWDQIDEFEIPNDGDINAMQSVERNIENTNGQGMGRFIKIKIDDGHKEFVGIVQFEVSGKQLQ